MNHYSPSYEPASERVMLLDIQYNEFNDREYGHLTASVVRRAVPDSIDPDTQRVTYNDGKPEEVTGYRNCSWSSGKANALFVEDMIVTCQYGKRTEELEKPPYGEEVRFKPFSVKENDALAMAKTFTALRKGMDKIAVDFGYAKNYAELVIRTAKILGIKKFAVKSNRGRNSSSLNQPYREFDASNVEWHVANLIELDRTGKA